MFVILDVEYTAEGGAVGSVNKASKTMCYSFISHHIEMKIILEPLNKGCHEGDGGFWRFKMHHRMISFVEMLSLNFWVLYQRLRCIPALNVIKLFEVVLSIFRGNVAPLKVVLVVTS